MTSEQLDEIEKDAARRDEATATILMLTSALREAHVLRRCEEDAEFRERLRKALGVRP